MTVPEETHAWASWKDREVIIVGGGIGGLAAALALARSGIASQIIEQAPEFKEIGAGIQLGPNVFWMFEVLGLIEPVSALAVFPDNLIMMELDQRRGSHARVAWRSVSQEVQASLRAHSSRRLHKVLLDACRKSDRIRLDAGQKVVKVEENNDGVTVQTESGREYRGAALIGADGVWSMIRQIVAGDGEPRPAGHITYRAVLPTSEMPEKFRWRDMVVWAGEKVHLVHYPLRTGDLFNLVAVFYSDRYEEGWDSYGDPAELYERFAKTCEPVRTLLGKIESWRSGWCAIGRRSRSGAAAALRSSATPRIRCCNIWRRAQTWRSKMRSVSPTRSSSTTAIIRPLSAPIRRRVICAPAGCRSRRGSTVSSFTPAAWPRSCVT